MRNFLLCLLLSIIFLSTASITNCEDDWGSFSDIDKAWDGQKPITNKEYEDVINALESQKNRSEEKKKKKAGSAQNAQDAGALLKNLDETRPVLNLTVRAFINDSVLEPGHYKVLGRKINDEIVLLFCQGRSIIAKVPAYEVDDDFNESSLNFIKTEFVNDNKLRIMFGSLEFNALGYIYYDNLEY